MKKVWLWLHIVRRRNFSFWWPLVLVGILMFVSLMQAQQQRNVYLHEYRAQIRVDMRTSQKVHTKDFNIRAQELKKELALTHASPQSYLSAYLATLKAYQDSPSVMQTLNPDGTVKKGVQTPNAVLYNGSFADPNIGELKNAITELSIVKKKHLAAMMPARLLANEHTEKAVNQKDSNKQRRALARFYEYGWYKLQNFIENDFGLVFIAVLLIVFTSGFAFQRQRQTNENLMLQLANVSETRNYLWSFGIIIIGEFLSGLSVVGVFLLSSFLVNGPGSFSYPLQQWVSSTEINFIPLFQMLGRELALLSGVLVLMTAFSLLLAEVFGRVLAAVLGSIAVMLLGLIAPTAWWSPFAYFHVHRIADRFSLIDVPFSLEPPPVTQTVSHGVLVLLAWSLGVMVLTIFVIQIRSRRKGA